MEPGRFDVVVAGGGPAGCAAALALARAGRSVLLADAGGGPPKVGEALPSVSRVLLGDLGVGERPLLDGHLPCYANLSAWGSAALGCTDFIRDPHGPGWHLDRTRFDRCLRDAVRTAGASVVERSAVRVKGRRADGSWVVGAGGRVVQCRWLVDATGRGRAIASRERVGRRRTDRLLATCVELDADSGAETSSLVESTPDGWWYTALLPTGRRLVAYFTDADLNPPDRASFSLLLRQTRHIAARVDVPPAVSLRRAPAHSSHLDTPVGDGWLAVGDATTAFDPVSSQGILTALHTGMAGGNALHAHLDGDPAALDSYRRNVRALLAAYQRNHRAVYGLERRWPDRPFWQRRLSRREHLIM
jgi:flavin-dependent dehydrogenase